MNDYHESEAVKVTILDSGTHTQEPAPWEIKLRNEILTSETTALVGVVKENRNQEPQEEEATEVEPPRIEVWFLTVLIRRTKISPL